MSGTSITFDSAGISLADHCYVPDDDGAVPRPSIVVSHPGSGVKEQAAALYAQRLADQGVRHRGRASKRSPPSSPRTSPPYQPSGRFPLTSSPNGAPRGVATGGASDPQHETDSPTPSTGPVLRFGTAVPRSWSGERSGSGPRTRCRSRGSSRWTSPTPCSGSPRTSPRYITGVSLPSTPDPSSSNHHPSHP
jgi:hypothetical protein